MVFCLYFRGQSSFVLGQMSLDSRPCSSVYNRSGTSCESKTPFL